jgi:hypothetical protein
MTTTYNGPDRRKSPRANPKPSAGAVIIYRLWALIAYSDTTPTRFMLALAATGWALLLIWPGDTFERPVYRFMKMIGGDNAEAKWCIAWAAHAGGMWWRIFSSVPRPGWALAVHTLGVILFTSSAISIFLTLTYPLPAAVAPDFVLALAAFWVLVRTHVNNERGWRND